MPEHQHEGSGASNDHAPQERGIIIRCVWCKKEQRLAYGRSFKRMDAEFMLHLMTGGHSGKPLSGIQMWSAVGTESQLGKSQCCDAQTEGELYGAWEEDQGQAGGPGPTADT